MLQTTKTHVLLKYGLALLISLPPSLVNGRDRAISDSTKTSAYFLAKQSFDSEAKMLFLEIDDLSHEARRLNIINLAITNFTAGNDLAALANPLLYPEFDRTVQHLKIIMEKNTLAYVELKAAEAKGFTSKIANFLQGATGTIAPLAFGNILNSIEILVPAALDLVRNKQDVKKKLFHAINPGSAYKDGRWSQFSAKFQNDFVSFLSFLKGQNDQNVELVDEVRGILEESAKLQGTIAGRLLLIANLVEHKTQASEALHRENEELKNAVTKKLSAVLGAEGEFGGRLSEGQLQFLARVRQLSGSSELPSQVDNLIRKTKEFYRSSQRRGSLPPSSESLSPQSLEKWRELADKATESIAKAEKAFAESLADVGKAR